MLRPFKLVEDNFVRLHNRISWKDSVGCYGIFEHIETKKLYKADVLNWINYKTLEVRYDSKIRNITTSNFKSGALSELFGIMTFEFKYAVDSMVKVRSSEFKILKQFRFSKDNSRGYEVECLDCGEISVKQESDLKLYGCKFCANREITDKNNALVTYPNLQRYVNPEELKLLAPRSNKFVLAKCDICGFEKSMKVDHLVGYGFSCPRCSDGVSIPEKFCLALLDQLNIRYKYQYTPSWSNKKKYDFYLQDYKILLEVHGDFHYKDTTMSNVLKVKENDEYKKRLALENGINTYIEVDARKSEFYFLVENFTHQLSKFIDLSKVNWDIIWESSQKSIFVEAYTLWNGGIKNVEEISNKLKLHKHTISRYLKNADDLGLCNYKDETRFKSSKFIYQYDKNLNLLNTFPSASEASRKTGIHKVAISNSANENSNIITAGDFIWSYYELNYDNYDLKKLKKGKFKIWQYDKNLNLINTFENMFRAGLELGISHNQIHNVVYNKAKTAKGFIFKNHELTEEEKPEILEMLKPNRTTKKFYQYSKDYELINVFNSRKEASEITGISEGTISDCANGRVKSTRHDFIFSHAPLREIDENI